MPTRWVGIDEAGYGPNLGPLVMTAVVAESDDDRPPDLWGDLPATVCRAGGPGGSLWVDDSKAVFRARKGRDRLETACLAWLDALGSPLPTTVDGLFEALGAGGPEETELGRWPGAAAAPGFPDGPTRSRWAELCPRRPFAGAPWRPLAVRAVVVGPAAFNAGLALPEAGNSKARVHFAAFARLLRFAWDDAGGAANVRVTGDKHGGRHFYAPLLAGVLPGALVEAREEGPGLSRYVAQGGGRRLEVSLRPRADSGDGLVALASLVSKALRECWMDRFHAFWEGHVPGLRSTAGYPGDSGRYRAAIEPRAAALGLTPEVWWRPR